MKLGASFSAANRKPKTPAANNPTRAMKSARLDQSTPMIDSILSASGSNQSIATKPESRTERKATAAPQAPSAATHHVTPATIPTRMTSIIAFASLHHPLELFHRRDALGQETNPLLLHREHAIAA